MVSVDLHSKTLDKRISHINNMQARNTNVKFLLRRATADQWAASRRILLDGEPGYDTTNNILKVGRNGKLWPELQAINASSSGAISGEWIQYYLLSQPPRPTPISHSNPSGYKQISWTYPAQIPVGFNEEPLPVVRALNVYIVHGGGTMRIIDNVSTSPYVFRSGGAAPITTLRLYADSTSENIITGTTVEYRNTQLRLLSGTPVVEVWYTNFNQTAVSKATVGISLFSVASGPPSQVRSVTASETFATPRQLQISFVAPQYANSTVTTDGLATITGYKIDIDVPGRPSLNKTNYDIGLSTIFNVGTAYAGQTYNYKIYAYNSYGQFSQTSLLSYTVALPSTVSTILSVSTSNITYFSNVTRYVTSGNQKISSSMTANSIVKTFGDIIATGRFPVGNVNIGGVLTSAPVVYSSSSGAATRDILNTSGSQIGTIVSSQAAIDIYNDRDDWRGTSGFYMPSNTITLTSPTSLYGSPSRDPITINIVTANAITPVSFYISNLSNSSTLPDIQDQTMTTTITKRYVSGFDIGASIDISLKAVTTRATFGDFFFPNSQAVIFNVLGQSRTYEITNMYTINSDSFWVIDVPSPAPSTNATVKNPQTPVSGYISTSLYAGPIQGTVTIKNLNGPTTASLAPIGFGSSSNLIIDNESYNFSQPNRVGLIVPSSTVFPGSSSYNNNTNIRISQNLIVYNGKYRTPGAIPSSVQSIYSLQSSGPRYATFEFPIGSGPYTSGLNITVTGIESNIVQSTGNWEMTVNGSLLHVYYRFETQYTSDDGTDYRIPQDQYDIPDGLFSTNYTTGWINANNSSSQNITSSNYNQTTILNGLGRSNISGSNSVVFDVFQPNIYIPAGSPSVKLYVTIGGDHASNISFSGCNISFN